jgi:hypothetical protein
MKHLLTVVVFLLALTCCTTEADRIRMRAGLDSINMRNRNDLPFTVSDVQPYVTFFDEHGTPNDRLLAHYLLGRAYHDHGEAPMALQCFQDAVDCADTTATDCDFAQLARVYGQMGDVFYTQGLYRQALDNYDVSSKYAWMDCDTLTSLIVYEQKTAAYKGLGYTDSSMIIAEEVAKKYMQYGFSSDAAISLGTNIRPLIDKGDLEQAKKYMDSYESQSGFFDTFGNIESGREIYYKSKGLYYLYINKLDSADYYFRKEMHDGKDFNNQSAGANGMAELYKRLHQPDSVAKYSHYSYIMLDSLYAQRTTKDIERIQAMYNYTRHQEIARQESERAARANKKLLISLVILLAVLLLSSWLYIARKKLIEDLQATATELDGIKKENHELKRDVSSNQQQIIENEKRITQLEKKLGRYSKLIFFGIERTEDNLKNSPNYQWIKDIAYKGKKLTSEDWKIIHNLANEYLPGFYDFIILQTKIDSTEYRICLLLRLHFKAGEIAHMLGVTAPYISKTSTEIMADLYEAKGSSKELYKELCKIS